MKTLTNIITAVLIVAASSSVAQTALPVIPAKEATLVSTFDRWWITKLTVIRGELVIIEKAQYDGTHILAGVGTSTQKLTKDDPDLKKLVDAALSALQQRARMSMPPVVVAVDAPIPGKPIQTTALFPSEDPAKPIPFTIPDTEKDAATDPGIAVMLGGFVAYVAIDAGKGSTDARVRGAVTAAQAVLTATKAAITAPPPDK